MIVAIFPGEVDRNFSNVAVLAGSLRFVARARRLAMSDLRGARVSLSRSAVCAVRELMLVRYQSIKFVGDNFGQKEGQFMQVFAQCSLHSTAFGR